MVSVLHGYLPKDIDIPVSLTTKSNTSVHVGKGTAKIYSIPNKEE